MLFTSAIHWHEFYFRDYVIRKNFELNHFEWCQAPEVIERAMKMAGQNTFLVGYTFECPHLKDNILKSCANYDSKCYDLGAKDAFVILKVFEPESQAEKVRELDLKFATDNAAQTN